MKVDMAYLPSFNRAPRSLFRVEIWIEKLVKRLCGAGPCDRRSGIGHFASAASGHTAAVETWHPHARVPPANYAAMCSKIGRICRSQPK